MLRNKIIVVLLVILVLSGCAPKKGDTGGTLEDNQKVEEKPNDRKPFATHHEVRIPRWFMFEDEDDPMDDSDIIAQANEQGFEDVSIQADGTIVYKKPEAQYREIMDEIHTGLTELIEEFITGDDIESIVNIEHDKFFTDFKVYVDKEKYENSFEGFMLYALLIQAAAYQVYSGAELDQRPVHLSVIDADTGEVMSSSSFPE